MVRIEQPSQNRSGDVFEATGAMETSWGCSLMILEKIKIWHFSKFWTFEIFGKSDFGIFLGLEMLTRFLDAPPQLALCQHGVKRFGRFGTFLVDENEF